jgi:hypothetical protein
VSLPVDRVLRVRVKEPLRFQDLTERLALKLSALPDYAGRAHFMPWHRLLGTPDFQGLTGVFSPLVHVAAEVTDAPVAGHGSLEVRGATRLAKMVDDAGRVRRLLREGTHELHGPGGVPCGRVRFVNAFTRYDPDPVRRRVLEFPPEWKLGGLPARIAPDVPDIGTLIPAGRRPDFADAAPHAWHYGHTDANRHVNGIAYLRVMEDFVADSLLARGVDLSRLYFAATRIVYRKPCFTGEGFRRVAWYQGEAPLVVAGAFFKTADPPDAPPAVAVELTLRPHGVA